MENLDSLSRSELLSILDANGGCVSANSSDEAIRENVRRLLDSKPLQDWQPPASDAEVISEPEVSDDEPEPPVSRGLFG